MTEAQIQAFFNSKVSRCLGGTDENGKPIVCLKDFKITSVTRPADQYCSGYSGAANESAARIIYRVSQACNINPQVLIVMLQKEQGLITHTWPSAWRYNIALGQGCPDTAPCDPNYIGFFHQIYGAARQMQIYMEGRWFQWYAPGKTWNILYNPNANCGSSPVYVANKATSALYYYTPYQPNAAALRAGYGTGDGCSAYGNRNFYNYFTDWFGSTQQTQSSGQNLRLGTDIYFVSAGVRYHVTPEDWPEYQAKFGAYRQVTSLSGYGDGGSTSRFVRNSSTGVIAYFDGGKTHRFASCDLVAAWGGACARVVQMADADFARIGAGPEMTAFARVAANGTVHRISGKTLIPLYDAAARIAANGGKVDPYAAVMTPSLRSRMTISSQFQFAPGQFVSANGTSEVYLATQDNRLLHLPSWDLAQDIGLSRTKVSVPAANLNGRQKGVFGALLACGGKFYLPSGAKLSVLNRGNVTGMTPTSLDAATCGRLNLTGTPVATESFVRFQGSDAVLHVTGGVTRHVVTTAQVRALAGGTYPPIVQLRAGSASAFTAGPAYMQTGTLVRSDGTAEVYLVDGLSLVHLPSWEVATALGIPRSVRVESVAALSTFERRSPGLTTFVLCNNVAFSATGGTFTKVTPAPGTVVTALTPETCAALNIR
ncbi:hypothetical protein ACTJKK_01165 [Microbacterium sp. 22179]|uniref:hypothetical protein n=1 Tax=Microbacterium sp. 22179 TaxID=3453886 RepID=UPI003F867DFB